MISALTGLFAFAFFCVYMLGMMSAFAALETGVDPKFFPVYRIIRKLTKKPTGFFLLSAGIAVLFLITGGALYELVAPWAGLLFFIALAVYAVFYAYRKLRLIRKA